MKLIQITIGDIPEDRKADMAHNKKLYGKAYKHIKIKEPILKEGKYKLSIYQQICLLSDYHRFKLAGEREIIYADWDVRFEKVWKPEDNGLPHLVYFKGSADSCILSSIGSRDFFKDILENNRYKLTVYSWQRKMLRDIQYNIIPETIYIHKDKKNVLPKMRRTYQA